MFAATDYDTKMPFDATETSQDEGERECLLNVSNESKVMMVLVLSEVPILFFENGCQLGRQCAARTLLLYTGLRHS